MKRYDPEHDDRWFLGCSGYQWIYGIVPWTVPWFIHTIVYTVKTGDLSPATLLLPVVMFLLGFVLSWCIWLF